MVDFSNGRGTTEQWVKDGKHAIRWTGLNCHGFDANLALLQLHVLAYNLWVTSCAGWRLRRV